MGICSDINNYGNHNQTEDDIAKMRVAGRLAAGSDLRNYRPACCAGVSTGELDRICRRAYYGKTAGYFGLSCYHGFLKSVCISVNDVVRHGILSEDKILKTAIL